MRTLGCHKERCWKLIKSIIILLNDFTEECCQSSFSNQHQRAFRVMLRVLCRSRSKIWYNCPHYIPWTKIKRVKILLLGYYYYNQVGDLLHFFLWSGMREELYLKRLYLMFFNKWIFSTQRYHVIFSIHSWQKSSKLPI